MNKKNIESELTPDQRQILEELTRLKQIFARKMHMETQDYSSAQGITIAKYLPHLNLEDWKDLTEGYGLYNWIAIPAEEKMTDSIADLQARLDRLLALAEKDPLTELSNRRALDRQLETEIDRCKRLEISLSIVMLDIDNFKQINDTYGHGLGDQVLELISRTISTTIRKTDFAARYGGEEFVILMSGTGLVEAENTLSRLMQDIRNIEAHPENKDTKLKFTVSAGLMCYKGKNQTTPSELLQEADRAMYQAKRQGKDTFVTAPILDLQKVQKETQVRHQEKMFLLNKE